MKASLNWLKDYVEVALSPSEVARRLTMAGFEAKTLVAIGGWEKVVIGQITAVNPHPNADRLHLATVNLGTEEQTVVCGAPNLKVGDKVAFAHVGAELIDPHSGETARLKLAKIRGVVSSGMVCSEKELGISDSHEGIMVLPDEAPIGMELKDFLGDTVLDLEITPNRPDCLSIIGLAREVAALTGNTLKLSQTSYDETASPVEEQVSVEIVAPDLCPRYMASLIRGVEIAPSPQWMQERLLACGMRPINNIVDITNYVMLEYGQPLHAFDFEKIRGGKIIVRRAGKGEQITSLDGVERVLSDKMLVIADRERAVAVAGVMGGANSEVCQGTTSILLEAASFNPASIHYTSRSLMLPSEASMRFERGISPEMARPALMRATQLIVELGGGRAARGVIDIYPGKKERQPIKISTERINQFLGTGFSHEQVVGTLASLGFELGGTDSEIQVSVPYWRSDIQKPVDLAEEVARIIGYDEIPATLLSKPLPKQNPEPLVTLKKRARDGLVGFGFSEVISYSLVGLEALRKLYPGPRSLEPSPLRLVNPMTAEQEYLRPNLRVTLLSALGENRKHEDGTIRLFELGRVYLPHQGDLPDEREVVCCLISGSRFEPWWQAQDEPFDFFDIKGIAEALLTKLGVAFSLEEARDGSLHPVNQAAVVSAGKRIGLLGEVHPQVLKSFEISDDSVYLFELDLSALLPFALEHKAFQPIPRFPATIRDIALVVGSSVSHQQILDIVKSFSLVKAVTLFDIYTGEQIGEGKKSLAYRISFQSPTHTLTDKEVNKVQEQILTRLAREFGATLRA